VQSWGVDVLGPERIDAMFGEGAAYKMWKATKERAGYRDADNILLGVGYTDEHDQLSVEWTAGAIMAARELAGYYGTSHADWAKECGEDAQSMREGIETLKQELPDGKAAYSYSLERKWIPFGWWAHDKRVLSTASTGWVAFIDEDVDPFSLPAADEEDMKLTVKPVPAQVKNDSPISSAALAAPNWMMIGLARAQEETFKNGDGSIFEGEAKGQKIELSLFPIFEAFLNMFDSNSQGNYVDPGNSDDQKSSGHLELVDTAADVVQTKPLGNLADAVKEVLSKSSSPQVISFGEVHPPEGLPLEQTALYRFSNEILPVLVEEGFHDLVCECFFVDTDQKEFDYYWQTGKLTPEKTPVLSFAVSSVNVPEESMYLLETIRKLKNQGKEITIHGGFSSVEDSFSSDDDLRADLIRQATFGKVEALREEGKRVVTYNGEAHNMIKPLSYNMPRDISFGDDLYAQLGDKYCSVFLFVPECGLNAPLLINRLFIEYVPENGVCLLSDNKNSMVSIILPFSNYSEMEIEIKDDVQLRIPEVTISYPQEFSSCLLSGISKAGALEAERNETAKGNETGIPLDIEPSLGDVVQTKPLGNLADAVKEVLSKSSSPQVISFGETHPSKGVQLEQTTLYRFSNEILPVLVEEGFHDLVCEYFYVDTDQEEFDYYWQTGKLSFEKTPALDRAVYSASVPEASIYLLETIRELKNQGKEITIYGGFASPVDVINCPDDDLRVDLIRQATFGKVEALREEGKRVVTYNGEAHNMIKPLSYNMPTDVSFGDDLYAQLGDKYCSVFLFVPDCRVNPSLSIDKFFLEYVPENGVCLLSDNKNSMVSIILPFSNYSMEIKDDSQLRIPEATLSIAAQNNNSSVNMTKPAVNETVTAPVQTPVVQSVVQENATVTAGQVKNETTIASAALAAPTGLMIGMARAEDSEVKEQNIELPAVLDKNNTFVSDETIEEVVKLHGTAQAAEWPVINNSGADGKADFNEIKDYLSYLGVSAENTTRWVYIFTGSHR